MKGTPKKYWYGSEPGATEYDWPRNGDIVEIIGGIDLPIAKGYVMVTHHRSTKYHGKKRYMMVKCEYIHPM